jgi:HSP20 family protein
MLMRTDPFRDLDRLTESVFGSMARPASLPMDAFRDDHAFVVEMEVPGVDPDSLDLTVEKNVLTVTAERHFSRAEGDEITVSERPQGRFSRQLFLGESLDADGITANYDQGVLTLHIPIAEKAKPRKVEVSSGAPEAVEVSTSAS